MTAVGRTLASILFVLAPVGAFGQGTSEMIRGDIVKTERTILWLRSAAGGDVAIRLPESVPITIREAASLDAIETGAFVATAATPQPDGTLRASELRIFPESMRGVGEGHRPMATPPGSTMTNATVASVRSASAEPGGTMTNARVAGVAGTRDGRTLRLVYPGGEQTVFVPAGTPVARIEPGDASSLAPGAHVIVYAARTAGEAPTAARISVGKNGSVPPS